MALQLKAVQEPGPNPEPALEPSLELGVAEAEAEAESEARVLEAALRAADARVAVLRGRARARAKQIGVQWVYLNPLPWASFLTPLGLFLPTSIPFIWRLRSVFLPA
jgi:hypothetical protein